jgi:hypothetical protein
MLCPAAPIHEATYPDITTIAAQIGTNAHKWAEDVLTGAVPFSAVPEQYQAIESYISYVQALQASYANKVYIEQRVTIPCLRGHGTIDTLAIKPDEAEIVDLKFGRVPVDTKDNYQLILYAIGYLSRGLHEQLGIHRVKISIIQPNSLNGVTYAFKIYTIAELLAWNEVIKRQADIIFDMVSTKEYKYHAGDNCTWCNHRYNCAEYHGMVLSNHSEAFGF